MSRKTRGRKQHGQGVAQGGAGRAPSSSTRTRLPADRLVLSLALLGMLLAAYLGFVAWHQQGPALCAEGSGCDLVQGSQWSTFLGLPIALWGFGLYAMLAWTAWRGVPRLHRWRWLWRLSLLGLAISVYLTTAGMVVLQAVCLWCMASLVTITAIFVAVNLSRPDGAPGGTWPAWLLGNGLIALALVALLHFDATGLLQRPENPRLRALAEHLETNGVKYYGASWCANCTRQSKLFGAASKRLPYVECAPNGPNGGMAFECISAGVSAYPTWVIGGRHYPELMQPERLAALAGFDWEGAAER